MMQEVPELLRLDDSIVVQVASDLAMWPNGLSQHAPLTIVSETHRNAKHADQILDVPTAPDLDTGRVHSRVGSDRVGLGPTSKNRLFDSIGWRFCLVVTRWPRSR